MVWPFLVDRSRSGVALLRASRLRGQILRGELKPGAQLPGHRDLASMYSVSVGSVREAISMLISTGLIETRAGRGTYVANASLPADAPGPRPKLQREEVEELTEARRVIEVRLAALAAERATPEQVEALRRAVERMDAECRAQEIHRSLRVEKVDGSKRSGPMRRRRGSGPCERDRSFLPARRETARCSSSTPCRRDRCGRSRRPAPRSK